MSESRLGRRPLCRTWFARQVNLALSYIHGSVRRHPPLHPFVGEVEVSAAGVRPCGPSVLGTGPVRGRLCGTRCRSRCTTLSRAVCVCVAVSDAYALSGSRSGPQCLSSRTHVAGSVIVVFVSDSGRLQRLYLVCNGSIVCVMSVTSVTPSRGQPGAWSLASICRTRPSSSESWCA